MSMSLQAIQVRPRYTSHGTFYRCSSAALALYIARSISDPRTIKLFPQLRIRIRGRILCVNGV